MTEKDVAKSLLQLDLADADGVENVQQITKKVLDADRRRVRIVAWITGVLWAGSLAVLYWMTISLMVNYGPILSGDETHPDPVVVDVMKSVLVLAASLEGLIFAVLCTLLLMFFSRRAVLRQVNSNLVEISSQLKQLVEMGGR